MKAPKENIAFVIHGLVMGGAEKFLINLLNRLPGQLYHLHLLLLSDDNRLLTELSNRVSVTVIKRKSRFDISISTRIRNYLIGHEIQKVFCVNSYSFFLTKLPFLLTQKMHFFLSLHSTIPPTPKNYLQNLVYFRFLSSNDTVIFLCEGQRSYLKKKYHFGTAKESIINNGIDTLFYNPSLFLKSDRNNLRTAEGFSSSDKLIIKVARLHPEKGHKDAILALKILQHKSDFSAKLLFVGDGEQQYVLGLKAFAIEQGVEKDVIFLGEQKDVRKYLFISDFFTLTSHSTETFSLSALEAMSFGLPCSLTDIGGATEMIIEGFNGTISAAKQPVKIAESWIYLMNHNFSADNIRKHVSNHYSIQNMVGKYAHILVSGK